MLKIKFKIAYDGTHYFGWQRQLKNPSIQGVIEKTFFQILQKQTNIIGAGRTDRGVHARGQIGCCFVPDQTNLSSLKKSLQSLLPKDISITNIEATEDDFHPRYSAKGKIYKYYIFTKEELDPFKRYTNYHHPYPLDISLMKKAKEAFIGTKDFSPFANNLGKTEKKPNPIKTIYSIEIEQIPDGIILSFHGDGFLYKMVRNITGALIDAGENKLSFENIEKILSKKIKNQQFRQAPARGLFLESVVY